MRVSAATILASFPFSAAVYLGSLGGIDGALEEILELAAPSDGQRLIETGVGKRDWYDEEGVLDLKRQGVRFMDVTDHPEELVAVNGAAGSAIEFPKSIKHSKAVHELAGNLSKANLEDVLTDYSSFYTRYAKSDYGLNASLWLYEQIKEVASVRDDVSVELFDHDWKQKSVIARIKGSKHPKSVVIVGAHLDSINLILPNLLRAPGADDNGSGSSTILEVFRVLIDTDYVPDNTVEFHWYSAEELGLLGSQDVFAKYAEDKVKVKAMLQQDCTGYSAGSTKDGHGDEMGLITDFVDPKLTNYIKLLVDEYCSIPYVETQCGYACSDHASAAKYGYPSAFVIESSFDNINKYFHTTEDTIDKLDFDHMLEHAKMTLGYAYELGLAKFK